VALSLTPSKAQTPDSKRQNLQHLRIEFDVAMIVKPYRDIKTNHTLEAFKRQSRCDGWGSWLDKSGTGKLTGFFQRQKQHLNEKTLDSPSCDLKEQNYKRRQQTEIVCLRQSFVIKKQHRN